MNSNAAAQHLGRKIRPTRAARVLGRAIFKSDKALRSLRSDVVNGLLEVRDPGSIDAADKLIAEFGERVSELLRSSFETVIRERT